MAETWLGPPPLCKALQLHHLHHQFSIPSLSSQFSLFPSSSSSSRSLSMASTRPSLHSSDSNPNPTQPSLLVFSGGTAFNGVVEELKKLTTRVAHVLPVSDDGGSTAEIVRVLGGPAVGDIRSRCLRLSDQSTFEALAVRILLGHRLPLDAQEAKSEWYDIVEGQHSLWNGVSKPYRETIRTFLVYFQNQILRRSNESFCFSNGSIGIFFFAGARIFFESLDAAIFLFSRVSDIPTESLVLPVISTNDRLTLGCELWDGTIIRGQNEISHPTNGSMEPINKVSSSTPALPSRIKRVFYMSSEGNNLLHEVFPNVNPTVLDQLRTIDCIIYAMGSLFTSICPSLVLLGIGEIIASRSCPKVLLLNGTHDRETSGFSAACFVTAIADALNRTYGDPHNCLKNHVSSSTPALPSRIKRVFYMSSEGNNLLHEVFPNVNPTVLDQLRTIDCIIYAMGSLFTSICPSLVLLGIGEIIASRSCPKVLLLNGTHDRETSGFSAACFVTAIADALNRTYGDPHNCLKNHPSQYINTLLVPKDGQIPIVAESLAAQGIFHVITVDSVRDPNVGVVFEPKSLIQALGDLLSGYTSTNAIPV